MTISTANVSEYPLRTHCTVERSLSKSASILVMATVGAILLYLADKTGRLRGSGKNGWQAVEWLMMQMGSVGPMLGQAHHFLKFNRGKSEYAEKRYGDEAKRIYGVLNKRLGEAEYLAGDYSIADIATWPWIARFEWQGVDFASYPELQRWYRAIAARPAVQRGYQVPKDAGPVPLPP